MLALDKHGRQAQFTTNQQAADAAKAHAGAAQWHTCLAFKCNIV
jgi:hypothetical protein